MQGKYHIIYLILNLLTTALASSRATSLQLMDKNGSPPSYSTARSLGFSVPVQWRNAVGRKLAEPNDFGFLNIFYVNKIFDF